MDALWGRIDARRIKDKEFMPANDLLALLFSTGKHGFNYERSRQKAHEKTIERQDLRKSLAG